MRCTLFSHKHNLFHVTTDAVPTTQEGKNVDVVVTMSVSIPGPLGRPNHFTVTNVDDDEPYAGGINIKGKRLSSTLFLEDGNGEELARIIKTGGKKGDPITYDICSFRAFHDAQRPDADDKGDALYCWAKVSGDTDGDLKLTVETWSPDNGGGYVKMYTSEPYHAHAADEDMYPPLVFKRRDGSNVAFAGAKRASASPFVGPSWILHIAPGMDPCMIICVIAVLDELEK